MFKNVYEAERALQEMIESDSHCSAHFRYHGDYIIHTKLDLITYNPTHKTHFLLHSLSAKTPLEALNAMHKHLIQLKETLKHKDSALLNYTVQWYSYPEHKTFHSSFYGKNIEEVIAKFYYGKVKSTLAIHNIKLKPIC